MTVQHRNLCVDWLGYATVRIESRETTMYFDPGRYGVLDGSWEPHREAIRHPPATASAPEDGDLICVSHIHHYDPAGIRRVAAPDATVLIFDGVDVHQTDRDIERPAALPFDIRRVSMETELVAADCPVWTMPAYNLEDGPNVHEDGTPIHPKGIGCGFLVAMDGTRVFWPGDSDVLPGHEELDVSLFLPSIAHQYTMDRHSAAALAEAMAPELVVPIHYNTFESLEGDSAAFAVDVASRAIPVALDER
jgi:L-ascorbate metabolism protein UlaG (beta-lactamase superfamily)